MRRPALLLLCLVLAGCARCRGVETHTGAVEAPAPTAEPTPEELKSNYWGSEAYVVLDGARTKVRWSDGDSFKFLEGPYKGSGVRMVGFNTLETYGPVHRWGQWTGWELNAIARKSKELAASQEWACVTAGDRDGYDRLLVSCPDAAAYLLQEGHAHTMGIDAPVPAVLNEAMLRAQRAKKGIWAKGVPTRIITSLHSGDEELEGGAYNRTVLLPSGRSEKMPHSDTYATCQEVCVDGDAGSCLTYVPYEIRYKNKPDCLKKPRKNDAGEGSEGKESDDEPEPSQGSGE